MAVATPDGSGHDDVVSGSESGDARTHLANDSGSLVPADDRHLPLAQPGDLRQVGVAEAAGAHLDQNLADVRSVELNLFDLERL